MTRHAAPPIRRVPAASRAIAVVGTLAFVAAWLSALGAMRRDPANACGILAWGIAAAVAAAHGHVLGVGGARPSTGPERLARAVETAIQVAAVAFAVWTCEGAPLA